MDTYRREFLKLAGGVLVCRPNPAGWTNAREVVGRNDLGRIVYCRVSHHSMPEAVKSLGNLFGGELPIAATDRTLRYRTFVASYEQGDDRIVICGSHATLVVNPSGYERFA